MSFVGLLQFVVVTAGLLALATALATAAAWPLLRPRLDRLEPARRARFLTALTVAPLGVALIHATLCLIPEALGAVWPALDHCLYHAHGGDGGLCSAHVAGSAFAWILPGVVVLLLLVPLGRQLRRTMAGRRQLAALTATARPDATLGVRILECDAPFAATGVGAQVLVSSGLLERLDRALLPVVLAHERAHQRRRDPLLRAVAMVVSAVHLPRVRAELLRDLELASEQACDEEAAVRVGDRLLVARALLAVERLFPAPAAATAGLRFGGAHLVARVESLLAPARPAATARDRGMIAVALAVLVALSDPLHHLAENIITILGI